MTFLNETYFWGITRLPNLKKEAVGTIGKLNQASQEITLEEYVEMFEPEFMRLLLGDTLYENFLKGLPKETKYLVSNKNAVYTSNQGKKYIVNSSGIWTDLKNRIFKQGKRSVSACAYYVFVMIQRHTKSAEVTKGNVVPQVSNTIPVNDNTNMVTAWSGMLREVELFYEWLNEREVYVEYADRHFRPHDFGIMVNVPI